MARAVMQPVSGTFELRWQWHREDARPPERKPTAREGAVAVRERPDPAKAIARPRLDGVSPGP
jgi:hypothetical protein